MKVAIVHDWLVVNGGAEKVLAKLLEMYPQADVFTLVDHLEEGERKWINANITTSFIQNLPFSKKKYRSYLPLFPFAMEQFDLSGYELVISSSYAAAKGVLTGPNQKHVCYCHSPARYAWDLKFQYLNESDLSKGFKSLVARYLLYKYRLWDVSSSNGVDAFVANSRFVQKRIYKCYRRDSVVVYPPVKIDKFSFSAEKGDFYLVASRLVPYKRVDLVVEAFTSMPNLKLKVIGDGPEMEKIKSLAGDNVEILGYQPDEVLISEMQNAKAFVFSAEEDFGIMPVEAQACGTPVIALNKGGTRETVIDGITGMLFDSQTTDDICKTVESFEERRLEFDSLVVSQNSERFSEKNFVDSFRSVIDGVLDDL